MDASRLRAIRARERVASPGPWPLPHERVAPSHSRNVNYDERLPVDHEGCDVWPWTGEADMVFAYRARQDIPDLLAHVDALTAENERLLRGMTWAHYELAEKTRPDTLWLMDLLSGLLAGKTADQAAGEARHTRRRRKAASSTGAEGGRE